MTTHKPWDDPKPLGLRSGLFIDSKGSERVEEAKTRRSMGAVITISIALIAVSTLVLIGIVAVLRPEALDSVTSALQPGTLIISCVTALGGLAAGLGINGGLHKSDTLSTSSATSTVESA